MESGARKLSLISHHCLSIKPVDATVPFFCPWTLHFWNTFSLKNKALLKAAKQLLKQLITIDWQRKPQKKQLQKGRLKHGDGFAHSPCAVWKPSQLNLVLETNSYRSPLLRKMTTCLPHMLTSFLNTSLWKTCSSLKWQSFRHAEYGRQNKGFQGTLFSNLKVYFSFSGSAFFPPPCPMTIAWHPLATLDPCSLLMA